MLKERLSLQNERRFCYFCNTQIKAMMLEKLGKEIMIFDGAMGTELIRKGIIFKQPEMLNLRAPDLIAAIHKDYIDAGCDFITTNTFGANRINMPEADLPSVITAAIANAKKYRTSQYVMLDIGPIGKMPYPMDDAAFDHVYQAFKEVVDIASPLVDGFILETFFDLTELKCAMLAVRENCDKPVFTTMTFEASVRTFTGTSPCEMAALMDNMGADAIGVNCSLGPRAIAPVVEELLCHCRKPIILQPSRGLPRMKGGKAFYNLPLEEFAAVMEEYCRKGVAIVGGCCGTTPEFIRAIDQNKGKKVAVREQVLKMVEDNLAEGTHHCTSNMLKN